MSETPAGEHSADCVPLCGATKAYGKNARWWHHEPACPARIRPSEEVGTIHGGELAVYVLPSAETAEGSSDE